MKLSCGKELIAREGETVTVFADVPGEPPADDIKWSISATQLVDDAKSGIVIDNSKEYKSKLQIDAVSRKHEGKYLEHLTFLSRPSQHCQLRSHHLIRDLLLAFQKKQKIQIGASMMNDFLMQVLQTHIGVRQGCQDKMLKVISRYSHLRGVKL